MLDCQRNHNKVTHCIFDLDGTLLDTETIYAAAIQQILDSYGKTYTNELRMQCMSLEGNKIARLIVEHYELPMTPEDFRARKHIIAAEKLPQVQLMPGVERLLRHLYAHNIPMAIATGSSLEMFKLKMQKYSELFKVFHHIVGSAFDAEVKNNKPKPDIYLIAASRFAEKPKPASCLVFEDSPLGLQAALGAGMPVIMVPESFVPCEMSAGAIQRLSSLLCFRPQDFGLPAYST